MCEARPPFQRGGGSNQQRVKERIKKAELSYALLREDGAHNSLRPMLLDAEAEPLQCRAHVVIGAAFAEMIFHAHMPDVPPRFGLGEVGSGYARSTKRYALKSRVMLN